MYKFCVIGAGVVGGLTARELTRYEKSVIILERENDVAMGQSKANSGIVHAGYDPVPGTLKAKMNIRGAEIMEKTCRELKVKYVNNGSLVTASDKQGESKLSLLLERGMANGVKGLKIISGDEARKMEPMLTAGITAALYAPTAGVVCPYQLTIRAVGCAMDNGAVLRRGFRVSGVEKISGGYRLTDDKGETVEAETVINAAGLYADEAAAMVGDTSFEIIPKAGEYYVLDKSMGDMLHMTVFRTPDEKGKGVLATRTVDGNILLGPTSEKVEDKDDQKTTASGLKAVESGEKAFFDTIPLKSTITQFTGVRAHSSTGDFIINMPVPGFINLAGIESPGLTSAPAIAEAVIELLISKGEKLTEREDYDPCYDAPLDFGRLSPEEKNEAIARRPEFGHVVCRCEGITEGEIVDAVRYNPGALDADGIKRRTRSGMGRCQGGFCLPSVLAILERELNIKAEAVTKKGGGSAYVLGRTKHGGERIKAEKAEQNECVK